MTEPCVIKKAAIENPKEILPPYDRIYREAGYEGLKAFFDCFGGAAIYVPTLRTVLSKCIEAEARKDRKRNYPVARIARKYGYSIRHLRRLLG